ncbi:hypothetical protein CEY16_08050 [Halalkalibacillus sediminis]|uniref:Transcriptional regulator n=1 Tax=Halalkalibacillus sediminis TaxID=2018042 RepID=A0A2I0QU61_9BACI|nr:hypothetical protein [Halalkalibacillus sediminis]PKR77871.1 hypothetical protein CEY16_08050 [Halalkalibacillus sediminis]
MRIQIGVVGPQDSIAKVMDAGEEFEDLNLQPFPYKKTEETHSIIESNREQIDQWFFTGPVPYKFAIKNELIKEREADYAHLHGSSLFGTLLEANLKENKVVTKISLDSIGEKELNQIKDSYALQNISIVSEFTSDYVPYKQLVEFHERCYLEGNTEVALTCIQSAYKELKKRGVPAYRISQSDLSIKRALMSIREKALAKSYRKKQLVIFGVEVLYPETSELSSETFKIRHRELELNRVLLEFVELINGSLVNIGKGLYHVYTTRGEIELFQKYHSPFQWVKDLQSASQLDVQIGVGYGHNVLEANENVGIAFDYAKSNDEASIVIINEEKEVVEYRTDDQNLTYHLRNSSSKWDGRLKDAKVGAQTLSKIESLANHYQKTEITSSELAKWLKSTERNARRILGEMEKINLAKEAGEETGQRGRPRKVYRLEF